MQDDLRGRLQSAWSRLRRLERREVRGFRAWLEHTNNLIHLSALLLVPLLIAAVTFLSSEVQQISFLLFPPLASGTYTLFYDPDGAFASPRRFVGGLTFGAVAGLVAVNASAWLQGTTVNALEVTPEGAALAVFLAGAGTWALDLEEPSAFSTALLVLVTGTDRLTYVLSVATSSILVAGVFLLWRERFFDQRARYLYTSTRGDDRVLVPVRGAHPGETARLGARIAAAHEGAKVVLLGLLDPEEFAAAASEVPEADRSADRVAVVEEGQSPSPDGGTTTPDDVSGDDADPGSGDEFAAGTSPDEATADAPAPGGADTLAEQLATAASAMDLESRAADIEAAYGVPTEVLVAETTPETPGRAIVQAAHDTSCDLIVTPYETDGDRLAGYIHELFHSDTDTLVHRCADSEHPSGGEWRDVLVPVRRAGDVAHKMIDFATRLAGDVGRVSVCKCIGSERERADAERMLGNLAETADGGVETRVARDDITEFLARASASYDLVIIGSSSDRSTASRFVSRPTFERVDELDCDFAILDRNFKL
ncbi:HPP family protein [Haloglomus salinum]|jgi:nucleotide-binding universal stress UspA family protein|uniref:HPP family protein n=1 Tax=Haloglomus salinum TaxID=2962673 RepID=UPI0020C93E2D|nr:HPP family protein [Haloglomus salinum]